jgi:hypothetical protein
LVLSTAATATAWMPVKNTATLAWSSNESLIFENAMEVKYQ